MNKKMFDKKEEKLLKKALEEAMDRPEEIGEESFSEEFEERMKLLFEQIDVEAKEKTHKRRIKYAVRFACVFAAVILFCGIMWQIEPVRATVQSLLKQWNIGYVVIEPDESQTVKFDSEGVPRYYLGYVPDGFELTYEMEDDVFVEFEYRTLERRVIYFSVDYLTDENAFNTAQDTDRNVYELIEMEGIYIDTFTETGTFEKRSWYWNVGSHYFSLTADVSQEEMIKIFENILKK